MGGLNQRGFTMMEMMIVIAIIVIIASAAIPIYGNVKDRADRTAAMSNAGVIASAANRHNALTGDDENVTLGQVRDCTTDEEFNALCTQALITISDDEFCIAIEYLREGKDDTNFLVTDSPQTAS